jgi:hypothetical protein
MEVDPANLILRYRFGREAFIAFDMVLPVLIGR